MTRLEFLKKKHKIRKIDALLMKTRKPAKERRTCGECAKFRVWDSDCTYKKDIREGLIIATDTACDDFEPRGEGRLSREGRAKKRRAKKKEKEEATYKLDLYAPIPKTLKPCGFYGDTLTESVWLPYRDQHDNVHMRPSLIIAKKGEGYRITDFFLGSHDVKGTFPSQELNSLMSVKGVRMLESRMDIDPREVDKEIDEAIMKHLSMPDPERILVKRWNEGTYFYDVFDAFPIQNILGISESGKSRLCLLNLALSYHAEPLIDPTEATIFRSKEEDRVSLIIDEAEYLNHPHLYQTLRILINASYSKYSGYVSRYDEINGKRVKRRFDLYSPMCISGIAGLEGVTLSRAFSIVMQRATKDFPKANPNDYRLLRDKLYVLRIRHPFEIRELYEKTDISHIVSARFEELFKPLFVMTEFFGTPEEKEILEQWCREYEINFRTEALNIAEEEQVLVSLSKIQPAEADWYSLKDLADKVNIEYNRKVTSNYVSNILRRLGITKRKKVKGYTLFYCPPELLEACAGRIGLSFRSTSSTNSTSSTQQQQTEEWIKTAKEAEEQKPYSAQER